MTGTIKAFLEKLSKKTVMTLMVVTAILLGAVDLLTGYEISFSIFYLIPIVVTAWYAGRIPALALSAISAAAWMTADLSAGHAYSHPFIPFWNAFMRFALFGIISYLVAGNRILLQKEQELARTDPLTGASNSRSFMEIVDREVKRSSRYNKALTLVYMDIDDFKKVNDLRGHAEGDRLLGTVAGTIHFNIRGGDRLARLGGDEFAVLFPETDEQAARMVVEKLRVRLRAMTEDEGWPVSFSFGVLTCYDERCSADRLIKSADELMYRAKRGGKNTAEYGVLRRDAPEGGPD